MVSVWDAVRARDAGSREGFEDGGRCVTGDFASLRKICRAASAALLVTLPWLAAGPAGAQQAKGPAGLTVISPIFGQLVAFSQPANFVPASENATAASYIRESVPRGETVKLWSQMITVTGAKGLAAKPGMSPGLFAGFIADGFRKACPDTFSAVSLGETEIAGHQGFAAVASCGIVRTGAITRSETALILAIRGTSDYYTIQWAERAAASRQPPAIDKALWAKRLAQLGPIRLCPIVPGEKAPYASCVRGS